jgi:hypothetical protein
MHHSHANYKESSMKLELQSGGLKLDRGQLLKVRDAVGRTVCALEGAVWITEDHQLKDIVLEEGQCYRLQNPGLAIVHALSGPAAVSLN